jgi:hypothetical protein
MSECALEWSDVEHMIEQTISATGQFHDYTLGDIIDYAIWETYEKLCLKKLGHTLSLCPFAEEVSKKLSPIINLYKLSNMKHLFFCKSHWCVRTFGKSHAIHVEEYLKKKASERSRSVDNVQ